MNILLLYKVFFVSGILEANVIIYPTHCRAERRKGSDMEKSWLGKIFRISVGAK